MISPRFVVDASVTLAWIFNEENSATAIERIFENALPVVPSLWRLEVVNVILVKERRRQITIAQGTQLLELLEDWNVEVIGLPFTQTLEGLAGFARPYQLSAYDATYLSLAVSLALPLFTLDKNLRDAANRMGVALVAVDGSM